MDWAEDGDITAFINALQTDDAAVNGSHNKQFVSQHLTHHNPCKSTSGCSRVGYQTTPGDLAQNLQRMHILRDGVESDTETGFNTLDPENVTDEMVHAIMRNYEQNDDGDTKLHLSVIHQDLDGIADVLRLTWTQELLDIKNNLDQTALHLAVVTKQHAVVRTLVVCGASLRVQDQQGRTPLHLATEEGDTEAICMLNQPLDTEEVRFSKILPYHVDWQPIPQSDDIRNFLGETVLFTAARAGHVHIVKYLVDVCKHDINAQEQKGGKSVLHLAVELQNIQLLRFLLNHKEVDMCLEDYSGNSPLLLSRYHPKSQTVILDVLPAWKGALQEMLCDASSDEEEDAPPNRMSGN